MSELTQRIKAKYPQYANVPDAQLEQKVLQKYPQYKPYASKSIGGFVENVGKSAVKTVGDIAGAVGNVFNPNMEQNTLVNLGKTAIGAGQLLLPGEQGLEQNARNVGQFYKDRYGSLEKIGNTLYNDPTGAVLDASAVLGGSGAVLRGAGAVSKASGLSRAGSALSRAGATIDPFMQVGKFAKPGVKNVFRKVAGKLDEAGENIVTRGIGNPAKQAEAARKGGRSVSSFIDEYDLYDRSPDTAGQVKRNIINQYDDLAMNSGKQLQMRDIVNNFNAEIERLRQGVGGVMSDADQSKIVELTRRRDQLLQASGGLVDAQGNLISSPISTGVDTLTNFRRKVIDPDVPQSMFGLDARGSGSAQGVKRSRDIVKSAIDSTDPRLAKLGKDYGMAKSVEKILEQAQSRGNNRQLFNFTKLGGAGVGGLISGAPGVLGGFALETVVNNPKFSKVASKTMKAVSKAIPKAQKVLKPAKIGYSAGKVARVFNPDQRISTPASKEVVPQTQLENRQSYPPIVPSPATPDPKKVKPLEYKQPKSVFSNKSTFGSTKKVQRGSFY